MAIIIKLLSNSTAGIVPNSTVIASLSNGEIIMNTADAQMWVKHSDGSLTLLTKVDFLNSLSFNVG